MNHIDEINTLPRAREYFNKIKGKNLGDPQLLLTKIDDILFNEVTPSIKEGILELSEDVKDEIKNRNGLKAKIIPSGKAEIGVIKKKVIKKIDHTSWIKIEIPNGFRGGLMDMVERKAYEIALFKCNNNRNKTAKMLGVSIRTLRNKLSLWGFKKKGE
jgi:hypothetical protein